MTDDMHEEAILLDPPYVDGDHYTTCGGCDHCTELEARYLAEQDRLARLSPGGSEETTVSETPSDVLHASPDGCPVVVGAARNATQDILVCNRPAPCPDHPGVHRTTNA